MSVSSMKHTNAAGALRRCGQMSDTHGDAMAGIKPSHASDGLVQNAAISDGAQIHGNTCVQETGLALGVVRLSAGKGRSSQRCPMEVVFYKEILDHFGFPHQCELMRVSIPPTGQDGEIPKAIRQFERVKRVSNWRIAADGYEVVRALRREC